jgi:hypothetical protein
MSAGRLFKCSDNTANLLSVLDLVRTTYRIRLLRFNRHEIRPIYKSEEPCGLLQVGLGLDRCKPTVTYPSS